MALTADVQKGIAEECAEVGMDGYLSKPFSKIKLEELLGEWLTPAESKEEPKPDLLSAVADDR